MISAIIYDLGDIFFEAHLWREWLWKNLSKMNKFNGSFKEFYELYESYLISVYKGKRDYASAFNTFIDSLNVSSKHRFIIEAMRKKKYFEEKRTLYPGVRETLQQISKKGIKNIVLSDNENGENWIRSNMLLKFNINKYIYGVVTSKETGFTKPDPRNFDFIMNEFSLTKDNLLFVAHDKDEIDGASDYGIKTIEFNNYLQYQNSATFQIEVFSELLNLMNNNG